MLISFRDLEKEKVEKSVVEREKNMIPEKKKQKKEGFIKIHSLCFGIFEGKKEKQKKEK